ncbi:MAG: hypothetical protein IJ115_00335, partial [Erysipelotrichaceae bacterium]|nr:hypothetical protein [Erysipelotrichaceae bacterium]
MIKENPVNRAREILRPFFLQVLFFLLSVLQGPFYNSKVSFFALIYVFRENSDCDFQISIS